jgi:hypothetical protein
MKKTLRLSLALLIGLLTLCASADVSTDFTPPVVTFNAPGEGTCWQLDRTHPELGVVISAEDPSGVKQGQIWRKKGHYGLGADFRSWPSLWGRTYARDGSAPESVRETLFFRMLGFEEGEYTYIAEFADMARHNRRLAVLHVSIDFAPPTVAITSPRDGSMVCRDKDLRIDVTSGDTGCGVGQVQLYLNAVTSTTPVAVDTTAPYQLVVPKALLRGDPLRIIVRAIDKAGRSSLAEISVRPIRICLMRAPLKR